MRSGRLLMFGTRRNQPGSTGQQRTIQWSGYTWKVRPTRSDHGPGPNAWSDSLQNVSVDSNDVLTLRITPDSPRWRCVEIEGPSFGYGKYSFEIATDPNTFDQKPVFGAFTYDDSDDGTYEYREIDIEYSAWNNPTAPRNSWFTVHHGGTPYQTDHNLTPNLPYTAQFTWQAGQVYFSTHDSLGTLLGEHLVTGTVYTPGSETLRLNLWLEDGTIPLNGQAVTMKVNKFTFTPNSTFSPPPASAKSATFTTGSDGFTLARGATVSGGSLLLACDSANYSYAYTGPVYNLEGSSVDTKITALQATSAESWWFMRYDGSNYAAMYAGGGTLYSRLCENGTVYQSTTSYSPTAHLYWRIREASGALYYETSSNRSSWTTVWTRSHTLGSKLHSLRIRYECAYWGSSQNPTPLTVAAINAE